MMRWALLVLFLFCASADAQIAGTGTIGPSFGRRVDDFIGGQSSGGGTPVTDPCAGSDTADFGNGCAIALFGH